MSTTAANKPISTCSALIWLPLFRMAQGLDPSEIRDAYAFGVVVAIDGRSAQHALRLHSDDFRAGWQVGVPLDAAFFLFHLFLVFVLLFVPFELKKAKTTNNKEGGVPHQPDIFHRVGWTPVITKNKRLEKPHLRANAQSGALLQPYSFVITS